MTFKSQEFVYIFAQIRQRQEAEGHLALVDFDDNEYRSLMTWAQWITQHYERWARQSDKQRQAQLLFLAFTINFIQRHKYTDDTVFWPDFEEALGLGSMGKRFLIEDLLWSAYEEEGVARTYDGRGRRIVGSLLDELRETEAWSTQARESFVDFFIWYYRRHPGEMITADLLKAYNRKSRQKLTISPKAFAVLSHDCRVLTIVLDYALEQGLYLYPGQLAVYRQQITTSLGQKYDPSRLRLIRGNEQALIRLILVLQNHRTPAKFAKELQSRRQARVQSPEGKELSANQALHQWVPFAYGAYQIDSEEFRVVPHSLLRLEMIEAWPLRQIVPWRTWLGYKSDRNFNVVIGKREVMATPLWRSKNSRQFVWFGSVPVGEKLVVDGQLRTESAGADWQVSFVLLTDGNGRFQPAIAIERLVLYYPNQPHQSITIQASNGYVYTNHLREDGTRRFHRHGALTFSLTQLDLPVDLQVIVGEQSILQYRYEPDDAFLFSHRTGQQIQAQSQAEAIDTAYILFVRTGLTLTSSEAVQQECLPYGYDAKYDIYAINWEDTGQPFLLGVEQQKWEFTTRHEFVPILNKTYGQSHVRLQPHQIHHFTDVALQLYSSWGLLALSLTVALWDRDGPLYESDLNQWLEPTENNLYQVRAELFAQIDERVGGQYGRYHLLFKQNNRLLAELRLTLMPLLNVVSHDPLCCENEPYHITVKTTVPMWNPINQTTKNTIRFTLRPQLMSESCPDHPGHQCLVAQELVYPVAFPSIGENLELLWQPKLFGVRLYLRKSHRDAIGKLHTTYQPINCIDYYQLENIVLHLFAPPEKSLEIRSGAFLAWQGKTDGLGQCFVEDLSSLQELCVDEWTVFTVRCQNKDLIFTVRWTPQLYSLEQEDKELVTRFEGPSDTSLLLFARTVTGEIRHSSELFCTGAPQEIRLSLATDPAIAFITAEYKLSDGTARPCIQELWLSQSQVKYNWKPWLELGLGLSDETLFSLIF